MSCFDSTKNSIGNLDIIGVVALHRHLHGGTIEFAGLDLLGDSLGGTIAAGPLVAGDGENQRPVADGGKGEVELARSRSGPSDEDFRADRHGQRIGGNGTVVRVLE